MEEHDGFLLFVAKIAFCLFIAGFSLKAGACLWGKIYPNEHVIIEHRVLDDR